MSRLALDYLERTFKVGRKLESIERDLSNGFVFAVVLAQLGFLSQEEIEGEEGVIDAIGPELVLTNFSVVARGLRKAGIHLTRQMVASIVSEQAGAAANLAMQIKRKVEERASGQSSSAALLKYKESIKTLRPKEFVRARDKFSQLSPADKYHFDAKNVLDSGVFSAVDMRTLLGPRYETFRHATDADIVRQDEQEEQARLSLRSVKHDSTVTQRTEFRKSNQATAERITTSWEMTLETKRQRQIRDLQFELVTSKIAQLKGQQRNRLHDKDQIAGIDAFETNLKRNGLGGDDDGANLTISYEDADAFIDRIEKAAKKKWPTKEDAGDFMTQLKLRTADKRTTRYEKARRRRKMLLEQTLATSALGIHEEGSEVEAAQTGKQPEVAVKTKSVEEKANKYAQMLELGRLAKETIKAKSEEEIRLWAEKYRMMADENADETASVMQEIMRAREERKMQKHTQNEALCRGMVNKFIGDLFDGGNQKQQQQQQQEQQERKDVLKPNLTQTSMEFSHQLADLAHSLLNEFSGPHISLSDVFSLDAWPASATLAANIAKWSVSSSLAANVDIDTQIAGGESHAVEGEGEPRKVSEEAEATEPDPVLIPKITTSVQRCEAFVEIAQGVLETLLERTAAAAARGVAPDGPNLPPVEPDFGVTLGERAEFASHVGNNAASTILVVSDGSHVPLSTWNRLISWLGHDLAFLWDGVIALETSVKIRPLMEGKTPTVTFAVLVGIFLGEHIVCPAEFTSFTLPPSVLRTCTDLVEISSRIMSIQPQIEGGGAVPAMPFNDISLAALIGQSLWLRNFLADKIENCPRLAVVGKRFGGGVSVADSVIFARLLEWFLRGGTRDNIPPTEVKMQDALQSEADKASGAGGKKKAPPPAKGKGVENAIAEQCSISAAVWIRLREPKTAAPQQDLQNEGKQSISDRILDAFASSTWVETPTFSLDKEELELLEFAKSTARGSDGSPLRPLAVYCLQHNVTPQQMQSETAPPQTEEEGKPQDQGEIEFPNFSAQEVVNKHPIDVGINFTSEISISEAIVAIALLEGGVLLGTSDRDGEAAESTDESEKTMQEVIARTLQRLSRILHVRRGRLSAPEQVFYLHLTGENVVSMPEAFAAHSLVCEVQALERELYGVCLLAVEKSMLAINLRMREREAALISELKTGDARWQGLCQATLQQVLSFSNDGDAKKIKLALGDLICRLGDVVDERHMAWMRRLDQYEQEAADDVSELKNLLLHMSELLCSCTFRILEAKREAALSLAALLLSAAFTQFPWNLPRQAEAGPRMLLDRCRDDVRASALLLSHACGVQPPEEGDAVASWRDLAAVELPQSFKNGESLSSAALTEVYFESLSVSTALLSATLRGLNSCMQGSSEASQRMHDSVRRRHEYEHSNLADFARKLDGPQFLAQFIFTCSDDVTHDGVEALGGKNVCEARDMMFSLAQVHAFAAALSEQMYSAKQQQQQQVTSPDDDSFEPPILRSQRDVAVDLAVVAATKIGRHDLTISRGWRSPDRIESFIRGKLDTGGLQPEPDSLVVFFRGLISFLVLSAVSEPPSGEALVRLANSLSFATEDRLTASALFQKVSSDPKLSALADAVGAVAYCCLDGDGRVVVEDLLLTLCRCPQRLDEKNLFAKCLLLQGGEGPTAELNADADATDLLPCILQDGVSKAIRVAASIKHAEGEGETEFDAKTNELSPSSGAFHLRTCGGLMVRPRHVQWLSEHLKLNPPLQWNAGRVLSSIGPEKTLDSEIPTEWIPVVIGDDGCSSTFMSNNLMTLNLQFRHL